MKKKLISVILCAVMVMSLAACGSSSGSADATTTQAASDETEATSEAAETTAAEADTTAASTSGDGITIAMVPPAMISPYYQSIIAGAQEQADAYGYELVTLAPESEDDYAQQVQIVEDFITQGVDGIAICAINSEAIISAVRAANEAGIPVIMFNISEELQDVDIVTYVSYDQYAAGGIVADYVAENIGTDLKVAIIEGLPSSQTDDRMGGFVDTCEEKYPGIQVVASQAGDWEREKGMNATANMLTANPDVDLIYGLCDEMALGGLQAVREANSDALVIGFDGNPNAVYSIEQGGLTATLSANGDGTGVGVIDCFHDYFEGAEVPSFYEITALMIDQSNASEFPSEAD